MFSLFSLLLLSAPIHGDCLTPSQLSQLGFTPGPPTHVSDVCPDLFSEVGTCVDPSSLKQKMLQDMENLRKNLKNIGLMKGIFNQMTSLVNDQAQDTVNRTDYSFLIQGTFYRGISDVSLCYRQLSILQMGTSCHLSSGNATNGTIFTNKTTQIGKNRALIPQVFINLKLSKFASDAFQVCKYVFNTLCSAMTGNSTIYDFQGSGTIQTGYSVRFGPTCEKLRQNRNCVSDPTDPNSNCQSMLEILLEDMIQPYVFDYLPSASDIAQAEAYYQGLTTSRDASSPFFSRRLQAAPYRNMTPSDMYFNLTNKSLDLFYLGLSSNVVPLAFFSHEVVIALSFFTAFLF